MSKLRIDIWSDIACPWCYVGKRRIEQALAGFPHAGEVTIVWRAFELDPSAPRVRDRTESSVERLARKYGMSYERALASQRHLTDVAAEEGLDFDFTRARGGNTFDAHRLLHLAAEAGVQGALKERLLLAYFSEGEPIGDPGTLRRLAVEVGLDEAAVDDVLAGDRFETEVRVDEEVARRIGITGVPFFVLDRTFGVSGAQSPDVLLDALQQAWDAARPAPVLRTLGGEDGDACEGDACDVADAGR